MHPYRNYWVYSTGLVVVWAVVLVLAAALHGGSAVQKLLPVFGGFCIGWVTTTIARYVYPPPGRRTSQGTPNKTDPPVQPV